MSKDEADKAKLLFIMNEIAEYRMIRTQFASFGKMQGCFAVIPIFWPFLKGQRSMMKATLDRHREQLDNALAVWRDDLGLHAAELEAQIRELDSAGTEN